MTKNRPPTTATLFLAAGESRDALALAAERAGWSVVAPAEGDLAAAFHASNAQVALIDARDNLDRLSGLAEAVESAGAALLAILPAGDAATLERAFAHGATHHLAAPFDDALLGQALSFASRHADRSSARPAGDRRRRTDRRETPEDTPEDERRSDGQLEIDVRLALARDEIEVLFQPQVAIASGAIVGVEALARWRHPALGEVGAATLFAAAERAGCPLELSSHVQRRAVSLAAAWPAALAGLRLSVNVTAADIAGPDFASGFLARVDEARFPRERLTVEITENGLIDDLARAAGLLAELRAGGCRVAIDDFGTGYSSLAYLKALPLDYLKIDKRLADDIAGSTRDRVVVRGVIEMARSLGLGVVAEGVETEQQLQLLAAEGCTYYQGYLCSEPIDSAALAKLLSPSPSEEG